MIKPFHRIKRQTLLRHLIAWLLILVYYIFYSSIRGPFIAKFAWIALLLVNYISSFYILVIFIWPKVLVQKSILFLGLLIVLVVFFCTFFYFQVNIVTPWLGGDHPISRMNIYESTNNSLRIFLYIFFTSIGTYNNWAGIAKVKDDIEIEKKIINTEFLFLKNQFHSHLTFNFLNFCYYKIQGISSVTADSVEDFANMLRYSLKSKSDHLVLLDEEINYVKNYILFKKRIEGLKIQFIYENHQSSSLIHPKSFYNVPQN